MAQSPEMDRLEASVTALVTASDAATALIAGLAEQIRAVAGDKAKTIELADTLDREKDDLAAAVVANTPAQ